MENNISEWETAQQEEKNFWGTCANTYNEETKQLVYAKKMGIKQITVNGDPYHFDTEGLRILDIGGGPSSMLLKAVGWKMAIVIDPCAYPIWVSMRYTEAGIFYGQETGEEIPYDFPQKLDEVWIYNVLQHTKDPEKIIENAKRVGKVIRIFEWIDHEANEMHPHTLTEENLNKWLGKEGQVGYLNESGCVGKFYSGVV